MRLEQIVPWGRNASEYQRMFDLTPIELDGRILGCGDGPASFNAELTAVGRSVVSVDPIYAFTGAEIRARVDATYETIISQVKQRPERYLWREFATPDLLGVARLAAMYKFLDDYDAGKSAGRYIQGELPKLDFETGHFDLALCSHLLFLYTDHLNADFHVAAIQELLRVSREVRIFPLLTLEATPSPHVPAVLAWCKAFGYQVTLRRVPYEFQVGGDTMLQITRPV